MHPPVRALRPPPAGSGPRPSAAGLTAVRFRVDAGLGGTSEPPPHSEKDLCAVANGLASAVEFRQGIPARRRWAFCRRRSDLFAARRSRFSSAAISFTSLVLTPFTYKGSPSRRT